MESRIQKEFLDGMKEMLEVSGLSERWELDEKNSYVDGGTDETYDKWENFHWECGASFNNKEDPSKTMDIYCNDVGSLGLDENGHYEPYSLDISQSDFSVYENGEELDEIKEGSDADLFRDAFYAWADVWYGED